MPNLNWNHNPEIQKAAQRLKVFQKNPAIDEKLNLDPVLKDLFKELGVGDRSTRTPSIRPKAKTMLYKDFIKSITTDEDLEFRKEIIKINN